MHACLLTCIVQNLPRRGKHRVHNSIEIADWYRARWALVWTGWHKARQPRLHAWVQRTILCTMHMGYNNAMLFKLKMRDVLEFSHCTQGTNLCLKDLAVHHLYSPLPMQGKDRNEGHFYPYLVSRPIYPSGPTHASMLIHKSV